MTQHVPFTSRPVRCVIIRNARDLQAYLYPAPLPATVRVRAMVKVDQALRRINFGGVVKRIGCPAGV